MRELTVYEIRAQGLECGKSRGNCLWKFADLSLEALKTPHCRGAPIQTTRYCIITWTTKHGPKFLEDPKDHLSMRILQSGSKAQGKGDSRNHSLGDPCLYVVF